MKIWKTLPPQLSKRKKGATNKQLFYKQRNSLAGKLKLIASRHALVAVLWEQERPNRVQLDTPKLAPDHPVLVETERQLTEYFSNKRTDFDLPLEPNGSEFQKKVWRALREIPFGQTRSYLDLAKAIGFGTASPAVGRG